ncbi:MULTISPECIES: transcription termination/antitermination protein NusG [Calditerrivibrio]|uniref:transcription termination/antitermination protein NusG n=1 Tax=Calditerrivibrio TaxID=545865 RepID=UPI003C73475F
MNWYLIYTKVKKEDYLEQLLTEAGLEVLNPKIKKTKTVRNKKKEVIDPLFPCYLFVKADLNVHLRIISYTQGIRRLVGGSNPTIVPIEIIDTIKSRMVDGFIDTKSEEFKKGDTILIKDGPFKDFVGIFQEELDSKGRVSILLKTLALQPRITVDKDMIEKLHN